MLLFLIRVAGLYILNILTIRGSFPSYDSEQLIDDLRPIVSLSEDDILNGIYFELYSGDLVAHLYKQFVPGVDYRCYKI